MTRIEPARKRGLIVRIIHWLMKRKLGKVPTPARIAAHRARIFKVQVKMELAFLNSGAVPARVKLLAQIRTGTLVGCPH
jgi:hypothetical protein